MTWFKVDDSFCDHPKVEQLLDGEHAAASIAIWTLAGSWCAKQLTDGWISAAKVRRLGIADADAAANELVRVGLWFVEDDGYRFKDWDVYQPTREKILAERERKAKNQRDSRASRSVTDETVTTELPAHVTGDSVGDATGDEPVSHHGPTRPDPTKENILSSSTLDLLPFEPTTAKRDEVAEVFDHWRSVMGHPRAELDPKRRKAIAGALKRYSLADCMAAIDGCRNSPHHMGQNDRRTVYDRIGLIFDPDKIDGFIAKAPKQAPATKALSVVRSEPTDDVIERRRRELAAQKAAVGS
jgi:hypothetical protein